MNNDFKDVKKFYKQRAGGITYGILEGLFDFAAILFVYYIMGRLVLATLAWLVEGTFDASIAIDWMV